MTRLLAVVHHVDPALSLSQVDVAERAGFDGVVLIQMDGRDAEVDEPAVVAKRRHPGLLVGTNRLSSEPWDAVARDSELGLDLTWADDPGVTSAGPGPGAGRIDAALAAARARNPIFLFFGSVAFKTQRPDPDPAGAAEVAARHPWVVTTSGRATGSAPEEAKLSAMAARIGAVRLAVASGITPANAPALLPHVGWALVSTGISRSFTEFDEGLARDLVAACREYGYRG